MLSEERIKLNSLDDLKKYNLLILDKNKDNLIKNNVKKLLQEKSLTQNDLAVLTGICKQNISEIVNSSYVPGIVLAMQIAKTLNKPVEEVFELSEDAWVKIAKYDKNITAYIDLFNLEVITNTIRKEQIKNDGLEYIDLINNKCITKAEYEKILKNFLNERTNNATKIKWGVKKELMEEFDAKYQERYKKLGEKIKTISLN